MSKIYEALQKAEQNKTAAGSGSGGNGARKLDPEMQARLSDNLVVLGRPGSVEAEQFRFLRSRILRPQEGDPPKTVLITSSLPGEGKTFTACNLAVTIAQGLDEHVLLVDADLRNPMIHNIFGIKRSSRGLSTYLAHNEPLSGLLHKSLVEKLTVLPAGQEAENPAELLSSKRMHSFIGEVRDRYPDRLVILDSSPVTLAPETISIANEVDAAFLVVLRGITSRHLAKATMERFRQEKMKGIIFNMDRNVTKARYYGYGYSYRMREAAK